MKIPSLRTVVVSVLASMGIVRATDPYNNQQEKRRPLLSIGRPKVTRSRDARITGRWGINQRQIRKNRRRAFAAGSAKAFR